MQFPLQISPLQHIPNHPGTDRGISLFIKRDDLLHPEIEGSKGRKLAAVLSMVKQNYPGGIVTFGGAFSNHLHAVAVAGRIFGIPTIGILRGAYVDLQNPTLRACLENGMTLRPTSKTRYESLKNIDEADFFQEFPSCYRLPEGGNTPQAVEACAAIPKEILLQLSEQHALNANQPLYLCTPAGTGCTAAGIVQGCALPDSQVLIFPVSHQGLDKETILKLLTNSNIPVEELAQRFSFVPDFVFGGFARLHSPVVEFVRSFLLDTNILFDPIYTAKMGYGVFDMLARGEFKPGSTIVLLHTGGIQGWEGFRKRYGEAGRI